jgi:putative aldouronate transport system substrate-binding protein
MCKFGRTRNSLVPALILLCIAAVSGFARGTGNRSGGALKPLDTSKQVELVLYIIGVEPPLQKEIDDNFNRVALEKLNCTLKVYYIGWSEWRNKYPLLFSSGEAFDMAYTATWLNWSDLAMRGAFKPLDELWPTYAPKNYARQSPTALRQASVNDHLYVIPTLLGTFHTFGPIYRADLALPYGWDGKLENFQDIERYFQIVKNNNPGIEPFALHAEGSQFDDIYISFHELFGLSTFFIIDPKLDNPKLMTYWEWQRTPEFLALMKKWSDAGYWSKSALSDQDSEKFLNGRAALRLHNIDTYESMYRQRPNYDILFTNFLKDSSYLAFTQDALVIPTSAKNPERALALYDLITNDETVWRAFFYGIEGKSYELVNQGDQQQVRPINTDSYAWSNLWTARTPEFFLPAAGSPPDIPEIKAALRAYIKDGVNAQKIRSLILDTSSYATELAACQNAHQQYWMPLEVGYVEPVAGLKEYEEKMKAAGIEKVRTEVQKQLDAYLASLKK